MRVPREELGIDVEIDGFLGYIEHPGSLQRGLGWPIGLAFKVHVAPSSADKVPSASDDVGWFERLPDDMQDEQKGFLQAQHLHVPVNSRHLQSFRIRNWRAWRTSCGGWARPTPSAPVKR